MRAIGYWSNLFEPVMIVIFTAKDACNLLLIEPAILNRFRNMLAVDFLNAC